MEPNPLLADPAPPSPGPAVPQDPEELWAEAQRYAMDEPEEDPFGFGGGLDFLDDEPADSADHARPPIAPERPAPAPSPNATPCPRQPVRTASASSHGSMPCHRLPVRTASASSHGPFPCPRQPVRTASASSHGMAHGPSSSLTDPPAAPCQTKAEPPAPHRAVAPRADRRTALTAHLSPTTVPPGSGRTPTAPTTDREAELLRATASLRQRCASLAAELAAAQARQGPLLQRLHRAGRAFAELITPTAPTSAPMPFSSLHAVLSSYRGAPSGAPH